MLPRTSFRGHVCRLVGWLNTQTLEMHELHIHSINSFIHPSIHSFIHHVHSQTFNQRGALSDPLLAWFIRESSFFCEIQEGERFFIAFIKLLQIFLFLLQLLQVATNPKSYNIGVITH